LSVSANILNWCSTGSSRNSRHSLNPLKPQANSPFNNFIPNFARTNLDICRIVIISNDLKPIDLIQQNDSLKCFVARNYITAATQHKNRQLSRLGIVMLVMWVNGPVTWVVWGWITEIVVISALLCRNWLSDARIRPSLVDWKLMRGLFAQGAALAVASSASVALSRIDRVTLGKTMPADVLSQYAAAMTLLEAAFAFAAMLAVVVGAKTLFKPGLINRNHHIGITLFAAGIGLALALMLDLIANPLMTGIYGERYADSATYLRIAAGLLPLVFAQAILQAPLLKEIFQVRATELFDPADGARILRFGALAQGGISE